MVYLLCRRSRNNLGYVSNPRKVRFKRSLSTTPNRPQLIKGEDDVARTLVSAASRLVSTLLFSRGRSVPLLLLFSDRGGGVCQNVALQAANDSYGKNCC